MDGRACSVNMIDIIGSPHLPRLIGPAAILFEGRRQRPRHRPALRQFVTLARPRGAASVAHPRPMMWWMICSMSILAIE